MRIILQASPVVRGLIGQCGSVASDPVAQAQGASMTAQDSLTVLDTYGFIRWLGELATASVRGSMAVAVVDLWDIRPLCRVINAPCLEPWDEDSLGAALNEAISYSSALERPFIIRLNPLLSRSLCGKASEVKVLGNQPVFNRNWGLGNRWRLPRQWGQGGEWVRLALIRAREYVKRGEVLVEGYLPADASAARSLYINPLPTEEFKDVKAVEEGAPFLVNEVKALNPGVEFRDAGARREAIIREAWGLIDNGPIDPAAAVRFCLLKLIRDGKLGNVPLVISSPYLVRPSDTVMKPNHSPGPVYFMPRNINDVIDVTHVNPLGISGGVGDYAYGSRIVLTTSCEVNGDVANGTLVIVDEWCPPPGINVTSINVSKGLSDLCRILEEVAKGGVAWVRLTEDRGNLRVFVNKSLCDICGDCIALRCGAIDIDEQGYPRINPTKCIGCGICVGVCSRGAIATYPLEASHQPQQ